MMQDVLRSRDGVRRRTTAAVAPLVLLCVAMVVSGCTVFKRPIQIPLPDHVAESALDRSMAVIGHPYVFGGQSPETGFDCSGLIIWAYAEVYKDLRLWDGCTLVDDATMDTLWRWNVAHIRPEEMKPGDIVFITDNDQRVSHGGLFIGWKTYLSEVWFINASSYVPLGEEVGSVRVDSWPVNGMKRDQWFVGAGRLLTSR